MVWARIILGLSGRTSHAKAEKFVSILFVALEVLKIFENNPNFQEYTSIYHRKMTFMFLQFL